MKKFFTKKYFAVALVAFLAFAFFAATSGVAYAAVTPPPTVTPPDYSCSLIGGTLVTCFVYFIIDTVSTITGLFINIAAWLIQVGVQLSFNVYNSPFIQTGFGVSLSIANLGFVLAIIIIAMATILRSETYGYKKTLWRLIVMAILVNFGLVVTAPLVSFANGMTTYFMNGINGGSQGITAFTIQLAKQVKPAAADQPPPPTTGGTTNCSEANDANSGEAAGYYNTAQLQQICANAAQNNPTPDATFAQAVLSLVFAIIFKMIILIAFFAIGALMLVRYIWLAVLLVLLPFAWLAWIFPKYAGEFGKWWSNFIKWSFFPAAAMFFIWLALKIQTQVANNGYLYTVGQTGMQGATTSNVPVAGIAAALGQGVVAVLNPFLNDVVILGIMIGGLIAASSITGKAGSLVVAQAQGVSNAITRYAGRKTMSGARIVGRYASDRARSAGKQYNPATKETTTGLQRFGSQLQNIPGLKGVGSNIARGNAPETIKKGREEDIQKFIDHDLKSLTNEGMIARATSTTALVNPTKAAAIAQELARRNLTTDPRVASRMDAFVAAADRLGNLEKITANRPDLMPLREKTPGIMETREEATARAVKAAKGDIVQADAEVFNRAHPRAGMSSAQVESAVLALTPAQLTALGSDTTSGSQDRQNNLTNTLRDLIATLKDPVTGNSLKKEIERKEDEVDATGKKTGKVITVKTGKYELDDAVLASLIATRPEFKNLEKIVDHMQKSSNWVKVL